MKQQQLIREVYQACFDHDTKKLAQLCKQEFKAIFKSRAEGKQVFTPEWTVIRI
jgi:hypothetical protein